MKGLTELTKAIKLRTMAHYGKCYRESPKGRETQDKVWEASQCNVPAVPRTHTLLISVCVTNVELHQLGMLTPSPRPEVHQASSHKLAWLLKWLTSVFGTGLIPHGPRGPLWIRRHIFHLGNSKDLEVTPRSWVQGPPFALGKVKLSTTLDESRS